MVDSAGQAPSSRAPWSEGNKGGLEQQLSERGEATSGYTKYDHQSLSKYKSSKSSGPHLVSRSCTMKLCISMYCADDRFLPSLSHLIPNVAHVKSEAIASMTPESSVHSAFLSGRSGFGVIGRAVTGPWHSISLGREQRFLEL
jgi:hypothetical protein